MSHDHGRRRYLLAKRSVDARARDRRVRDAMLDALVPEPRVFEAGPGAGLGALDLREWGVTPSSYRGVDADPGVAAFAARLLPRAFARAGYDANPVEGGCRIGDTTYRFEAGDAVAALPGAGADLVVAQSFLDLVERDRVLDAVAAGLSPGGVAYAPLTFDGVTLFQPSHPEDDAVAERYHDAIDAAPGRDARAGRHVLDALRRRGDEVLAVGASDWIVRPANGGYPADERRFLDRILDFVAAAVDRDDWVATRREQVEAGDLLYVAHGYDLLWRPGGDGP
ncbi:SAM-dependent methyltransferase [Halosegnis marinus]|uniref:SAM-dependent methyltransferase n=1 Tax=Halosegnis marinus TaxID=3034023 RepID=A0ABD5ZK17_9EURY|nr:SAM-dependent methyltransferase [Halosegnis sp. DT85]